MEQTLKKAKVKKLGEFAFRIEHPDITAQPDKRRGYIVQGTGQAMVIPFKQGTGERRKAHTIRETQNGKLELSAARQRVKMTITFDRSFDSPEAFKKVFDELVENYVNDVIKYEINECLE